MGQDLREMFENSKGGASKKPEKGHVKRFKARLDKNFPKIEEPTHRWWLKIAALFVVALGLGYFVLNPLMDAKENVNVVTGPAENKGVEASPVYLSDISPAYKKIENYYLATIHTELAQLNITKENKALIDSFMAQLAELDEEYKRLNKELEDVGVNEQTVSVLIENLKLRLDLLFKLKNKLDELHTTSVVENAKSSSV